MRPIHLILALVVGAGAARLLWPSSDHPPSPAQVASAPGATAQRREAPSLSTPARAASREGREARTSRASSRTAPAQRESGAEMRTRLTAQLVASGDAAAPFQTDVGNVVTTWRRDLPAALHGRVELGPVQCHRGGCLVETISADVIAHEEASLALSNAPAFASYAGWRARSGDETDARGRVHATWFFMAP